MRAITLFFVAALGLSLGACSVEKTISTGWDSYRQGNYPAAESAFRRALAQSPQHPQAHQGLAFVAYSQQDFQKAIDWQQKAYQLAKQAGEYTYHLARFNVVYGNENTALQYLYELYEKPEYPQLRKQALREKDFEGLRSNPRFARWLVGLRRLKIDLTEAFSDDFDGPLNPNDLFAVLVYRQEVLLCTPVVRDANLVRWTDQFVVFDYQAGQALDFYLLEWDLVQNDLLVHGQAPIVCRDYEFKGNGYLRLRVEDALQAKVSPPVQLPEGLKEVDLLQTVGSMGLAKQLSQEYFSQLCTHAAQWGVMRLLDNLEQTQRVATALEQVSTRNAKRLRQIDEREFTQLVVDQLNSQGNGAAADLIKDLVLLKDLALELSTKR